MAKHRPGGLRATATLQRKTLVARLRLRGMTVREIQQALSLPDPKTGAAASINPTTGKPWAFGTIVGDLQELTKQWRESIREDTAQAKGEAWAEIKEVRREFWRRTDLDGVLKALKAERELLGLDSPASAVMTATVDWKIEVLQAVQRGDVTEQEVWADLGDKLARELFESTSAARLLPGQGAGADRGDDRG